MPAKSRFTRLDAFTKTVEDARIRTTSGGIVTIVSLLVVFYLVWGEWLDYRRVVVHPELIVDKGRGKRLAKSMSRGWPEIVTSRCRRENGDSFEHQLPSGTLRAAYVGRHGRVWRAADGSSARHQQGTARSCKGWWSAD